MADPANAGGDNSVNMMDSKNDTDATVQSESIVRRGGGLAIKTGKDCGGVTQEKRLTTPKKKWMQLWHAQHASATTDDDTRISADAGTIGAPASSASLTSHESGHSRDRPEPVAEPPNVPVQAAKIPTKPNPASTEDGEVLSDVETGAAQSRRVSEIHAPPATVTTSALRVTMPVVVGSSTLSPSGDHVSSPQSASTSISPSAKLKEADSNLARVPSPPKVLTKAASMSQLVELKASSQDNLISSTVFAAQEASINKRKPQSRVDDDNIELTESERLRLERRRAKKSKWDEGDPRKNGGSLDLATLNLLSNTSTPASHPASFARFPRQRPVFRQTQSLDAKDTPFRYRSGFRATVQAALQSMSPPAGQSSSSQAPRQPLHHSASLPIDQSRPPLRPSSRYLPHSEN